MKKLRTSNIASLGVLFLTLVAAPSALPGQNPEQNASKPATTTPGATSGTADSACDNLKAATEQFDVRARINEQELQKQLATLQERLAKEAVMSSPQLAKLQTLAAQLEANKACSRQMRRSLPRAPRNSPDKCRRILPRCSIKRRTSSFPRTKTAEDGWASRSAK